MTFRRSDRPGHQLTRSNDFRLNQQLRDLEHRVSSQRYCDLAKVEFCNYAETELVAVDSGELWLTALAERTAPLLARAISLTFESTDEVEPALATAALYSVEMIDRARDPLRRDDGVLADANPVSSLPGVRLRLLTPAVDYEQTVITAGPLEIKNAVFRFVRDILIPEDAVVFLGVWITGNATVLAGAGGAARFRTTQRGIASPPAFPSWPLEAQLSRPSGAAPLPAATVLSSRGVVAYGGWGIE